MLNEIYCSLRVDASAVPNPDSRFQPLLRSDALTDSSVVMDLCELNEGRTNLRELNEGRTSQYTCFSELVQVFHAYIEAVASDRRAEMPVAMSISDLSQKVQETLPPEENENVKLPSNVWIRLQIKCVDKTAVSTLFSSFQCKLQIREAI